ncbi:MAG: hypothetical protein ACOY0T_15915 [Myxococcota bacterium]
MRRFVFGFWACFVFAGCSAANELENEREDAASSSDALCRRRGCTSNSDCRSGQYCATTTCGGRGVCQRRPEVCTRIYDPVCGCDGRTYGNSCDAASAGVSVASDGECPSVFCGGIAGIPCPGAGTCVDDPSDDCAPPTGADCGGICECQVIALCVSGFHFDSSPAVCACVPDAPTNPCAAVLCPTGTRCVASGDTATCEPIDPCATVRCKAGYHCVANGSTATCEPDATGGSCGSVTCPEGTVCCNASCGWCRPPGVACIQIACD